MDILPPSQIRALLNKHEISPNKGLGQNFVIQKRVVAQLIAAADLTPTDTVLEVGPGLGAVTAALAEQVQEVIAVERDKNMVDILHERLSGFSNVSIVHQDILSWSPAELGSYKVVASLPYSISAPFIRKFLEEVAHKPSSMTLIIQKEVAQRMAASPPDMHLLSVATQLYGTPRITSTIKPASFWPKPKIDSAILHIELKGDQYDAAFLTTFFQIVRAGFLHPRRQLQNNLREGLNLSREEIEEWLGRNNIKPQQRAETLDLKDWIRLTKTSTIKR